MATATYGDEDHVEVQFLPAFRDEVLARSAAGRLAVWVYYNLSPYPAFAVSRVPVLRAVARRLLEVVVASIEGHTHLRRASFRVWRTRAELLAIKLGPASSRGALEGRKR